MLLERYVKQAILKKVNLWDDFKARGWIDLLQLTSKAHYETVWLFYANMHCRGCEEPEIEIEIHGRALKITVDSLSTFLDLPCPENPTVFPVFQETLETIKEDLAFHLTGQCISEWNTLSSI